MPARLCTTKEVIALCNLAKKAGFKVERTGQTAKIFDFNGETIVYQGLKKGSVDAWLIRFNAAIFEKREVEFNGNST